VAVDEDDEDDLRLLLAPGSSLGGARPKASVVDRDGSLMIAKFPHRFDETDAVAWEAVALELAGRAGVSVPKWLTIPVGRKSALLVARFDRRDGARVPFLSAMSMLGAGEKEEHSYLEVAEALRRHGAAPRQDLAELWRRIVFNVLISNTDDHLRNHGFLYAGQAGWRLSPAYDMNPIPVDVKARVLATSIDPDDPSASMDLALAAGDYFGLAAAEARAVAAEVGRAVAGWRQVAARLGIGNAEIERMASAFEHEDADRVRLVVA
jgi:serine/threonine-protein kinase HipA